MRRILLLCFVMMLLYIGAFGQSSTMTIREVFDFQPGDVFHRKIKRLVPSPPEAVRFEVLARNVSPGNDTICYTMRHFDYESVYNGNLVYTHHNYLKNVCYTNLDSLVHTLIDTFQMITTPINTFFEATYPDSTRCDSLTYRFEAKYGILAEPTVVKRAYGKGLGITEYYYDYYFSIPPEYEDWELVYFKKGPIGCGTPDTVSTEIAEPVTAGFRFYPNPSTTHLIFEFYGNLLHLSKEIKLSNTLGQVLIQEGFADGINTGYLDISHLPSGTYFLQVSATGFHSGVMKVMKI